MCKRAADRVYELGVMFFMNIEWPGLVDTIAPLVPDSIFQTGVLYGILGRETGDQSYRDGYELMRQALKFFDRRWKVAGMLCIRYLEFVRQLTKLSRELSTAT